ncbi:AAA family ATPase [Foetidibacter luteolus]|uniref:AAA family ATPase n=1 Tax=Foetidibacter luteolus TaxID=2608880 RepID=UPI00129AC5C7|nr:ATP-binding protein [Foetidibacter luteolus]
MINLAIVMLNSVYIKNYRSLKDLIISHLGQVNLVTGKNNTGKSTLLEAIALYASKCELNFMYQLLSERGENFRITETNKNATDTNIRSLSSLFSDRKVGFDIESAITIGPMEESLLGLQKSTDKSLSLRFIQYLDEIQRDSRGIVISIQRKLFEDNKEFQAPFSTFKVGLEIRVENNPYILPLEEDRPYSFSVKGVGGNESFQFIRTRNIDREINGKLWDNITLTDKEQFVIDALQIIEPSTERIAFIEENPRERTPVIKISGVSNVLPLRSMGDGINRILTIILALVNCDNGFLLIDEFENGLHYSVQEKLWEIIFHLSKVLNIQVFATTHSEDCIAGFENVLNKSIQHDLDGILIRLDNINGTIKQVEFSAEELKIATDQNIETR